MKRIFSLVLLMMIISNCGFCSSVIHAQSDTDADIEADIEAAQRLYAATDAYQPSGSADEAVSREEFLISLISVMGLDTNIFSDTVYFSDVEPKGKLGSAVEYALNLDIISPDEYFYPNNSITYNECFKMMVAALGYAEDANSKGGYPAGFIRVASQLKLDRNFSYSSGDELVFKNFYVMMRSFLEAPTRITDSIYYDKNGYGTAYKSDLSILEFWYEWTPFEGIINGNENTFLFDNSVTTDDDCIQIGETSYVCYEDYTLGTRVSGYSSKINNADTVVFMETMSENRIVTAAPQKISEISDKYITVFNEKDIKKDYQLAGLHSVIYNGKFYAKSFDKDFVPDIGRLTIIDNNSDGEYDVVIIYDGNIMKIKSINDYTEKIYDAVSGKYIDFSNDCKVKVYADGNISSTAVLKENDVIEYYCSADNEFTEVRLLKNVVTGTLTSMEPDYITVDDTRYAYSNYFRTYNLPTVQLGKENSFVLTVAGDIACVTDNWNSTAILAYLSKFKLNKPFEDAVDMQLYNEYGEYLTLQTASKIKFNDGENRLSASELYTRLSVNGEQTVMYKTDSDGKISSLNIENSLGVYDPTIDSANELKRYNFDGYDSDTATKLIYKSFGLFIPFFTVDANTKIILIGDEEYADTDAERFSIGSKSSWINDSTFLRSDLLAYNVEACGKANILICKSGSSSGTVGNTSAFGVVDSVNRALDRQEESAYKITLCANNQYKTFYVPNDSKLKSQIVDSNGKYLLERGDFVRYTADQRDELTDLFVDFDFSGEDILHAVTRENHEINYYYGSVNAINGTSVNLTLTDSSNTNAEAGHPVTLINSREYVWLVDLSDKTVTAVPPSAVISAEMDSENPDKMLLKTRYAEVTEVVIYRK